MCVESYDTGSVVQSLGGGRGEYRSVDGDVPIAMLRRMKSGTPFLAESAEQTSTGADVVGSGADCHSMVAMSWNACGMQEGVIQDVADLLDGGPVWDILLYQEGPYTENKTQKTIESGHFWFSAKANHTKRSVSILLNRRWTQDIAQTNFVVSSCRVAHLDFTVEDARFRFITCHCPHSGFPYTLDDYEACLLEVETLIDAARVQKRIVLVGIDANAVLGERWPTDLDTIIGNHGVGDRNEMGRVLCPWIHGMRLTAVATMFDRSWEDTWTHKSWSTSCCREIDYMFVDCSHYRSVLDVGIRRCLEGKSDHRPPFIEFSVNKCNKPLGRRQRVQRSWQPKLDSCGKPS